MEPNYKLDKTLLQTGYGGACYSNDFLGKVEIFFEKDELGRLHLPKNYPIPTHIFSIVVYDKPFTIMQHTYQPGVYVYEAKEHGYILRTFDEAYGNNANFKIITYQNSYTDAQKEAFRLKAEFLHTISKSYGFQDFLLEPIHTELGFDPIHTVNFHRVICSAAFAIETNAAIQVAIEAKLDAEIAFDNPVMETPLDVVANKYIKFLPTPVINELMNKNLTI